MDALLTDLHRWFLAAWCCFMFGAVFYGLSTGRPLISERFVVIMWLVVPIVIFVFGIWWTATGRGA